MRLRAMGHGWRLGVVVAGIGLVAGGAVAGARAAGLTAVLIDREGPGEAPPGVPVIASLVELLPLIGSR